MTSQYHILFVEDDDTISFGVTNALNLNGYIVHHYSNAEAALQDLDNLTRWDLAVIDWMLPGIDGIALTQHIKESDPNKPVILLTAKSRSTDIVEGLDAGADDYVTKPFQLAVLLARIRARFRENERDESIGTNRDQGSDIIRVGDLNIDLRRQLLRRQSLSDNDPELSSSLLPPQQELNLTTHETAVLQYLIERAGIEVTRQELLQNVWGYAPTMQTRTVDNVILKLRKKMEINPSRPQHILTVHGKGYRFEF